MVEVGIFAYPSEIDKFGEGLFADTVNVHSFFGHEAGKLLELFGRAGIVGAMEGFGVAHATDGNFCRRTANGTLVRNVELTHGLDHLDNLGDNLVGLDDREARAAPADTQPATLADVAERCTLHGGALQLHGAEDGHGRDGVGGARPLYMVEFGFGGLVLPLEGQAGSGGMMSRHGPRGGIGRVVVGDHQPVYGVRIDAVGHFLRPAGNDCFHFFKRGVGYQLPLNRLETVGFQPVHAFAPCVYFFIGIDQCEGYPADVALFDFVHIFERQRARCQIARVGIFLVALHVEAFKVFVGDDGLTADHGVPGRFDSGRQPVDGLCQMGDVGADVPVTPCDDFSEPSPVVGGNECQSVELPREPDGTALGPFHKFFGAFGLGQREGGKLVFFLLSLHIIGGDFGRGRIGKRFPRLFFQLSEPVEKGIPLIVGHQFRSAVIISVGGGIEPFDELSHLLSFVFCHGCKVNEKCR